ncbi:MAG TPA: DUF3306 domain-containing protein [Oxalicibacterium sp.]|nr:DUF3306 domain-containing protein [Oxalicibacterium sp.]
MAADDFFARWSKNNSEARQEQETETAATLPPTSVPAADAPPPTLEDAERLTPDADFSGFMAQGVDEAVKRVAVKKLFSDPHFNIMDGLDVYIDDYNKFEALTPDIIASLNHAKDLLDPLSQSAAPLMHLLDALDEEGTAPQPAAQPELRTAIADDVEAPPIEETEQSSRSTPPLPD